MNGFTSFIIAFCAACIFLGALEIICPDGNMSKPVKYAVSLVFLITVVSLTVAFAGNTNITFDTSLSGEKLKTESVDRTTLQFACEKVLRDNNIEFKNLNVFTTKTEDDSIIITKVCLETDCEKQKIAELLGVGEVEIKGE